MAYRMVGHWRSSHRVDVLLNYQNFYTAHVEIRRPVSQTYINCGVKHIMPLEACWHSLLLRHIRILLISIIFLAGSSPPSFLQSTNLSSVSNHVPHVSLKLFELGCPLFHGTASFSPLDPDSDVYKQLGIFLVYHLYSFDKFKCLKYVWRDFRLWN